MTGVRDHRVGVPDLDAPATGGRVRACGGAFLHSGVAQGGNVYRLDAPRRVKCHGDADPKYGLCDSCSFEERQDRERLRNMAKPKDDDDSRPKKRFGRAT